MQKGLIIKNVTNTYYVKSENNIYECIARGKFKQEEITPTVGDNVEIEIVDKENNKGTIEKVTDRKNFSRRPKVANLTELICVIATKMPKPDLLMLDKQLAYAEYLNVKPIIVVNKIDLGENIATEIKEEYTNIGYDVIITNAITGEGIKEIISKIDSDNLDNQIVALSGNSGVGKSSIINSILNKDETTAGEISLKNKKGKNTTTITSLHEISKNIYLVDTPGFSTFDINEIESKDLDKYFIEFREYINECEYQGCSHIKEERCGIKEAIDNNKISNNRYDRYVKIYEDLKYREEHKKW